jgi:hypothetical protein
MNKMRLTEFLVSAIFASFAFCGVAEAGTGKELKVDYIVYLSGNISSFTELQTGEVAEASISLSDTAYEIVGSEYSGDLKVSLASEKFRSLDNLGISSYFSKPCNTLSVVAVPEPETYSLMLTGIGMLGFMARRRKIST